MRRPRGPGGRFLTAEEIAAQKNAQAASSRDAAEDDADDHPPGISVDKEEHDSPPHINTPVHDEPALPQHINPYAQNFSAQQVHHSFQDTPTSISTPVPTNPQPMKPP